MFDSTQYQLDQLTKYPSEQWRLAIKKFPAPSNRPPQSFWRLQRNNAIDWLSKYKVNVLETQGKVYINEVMVDGSYVPA